MVNFIIVVPSTACLLSQLRRMRSTMVLMYSGQQKSPTSRVAPVPPPPPVVSPKPWPRAPVSATAVPLRTSAPFVGVVLRASRGAFLTGGGGVLSGGALVGSIISGRTAAGARTGSGRFD